MSVFFPGLGKILAINPANIFSATFFFSSPSGIPGMRYNRICCCSINPSSYCHFLKFLFLFVLRLGEFRGPKFQITTSLSCASSNLLLNPTSVFFSAVMIFFNSVISLWCFLIFSVSLLKFSQHSTILLPTSVDIFMTITLDLYQVNYLPPFHWSFLFPWGFIMFFYL